MDATEKSKKKGWNKDMLNLTPDEGGNPHPLNTRSHLLTIGGPTCILQHTEYHFNHFPEIYFHIKTSIVLNSKQFSRAYLSRYIIFLKSQKKNLGESKEKKKKPKAPPTTRTGTRMRKVTKKKTC